MSTEQNKAFVRRFWEAVMNKGNLAVADEILAADYVQHDPNAPEGTYSREEWQQIATMFRAAFPDLHVTIEDLIAEGDKVVHHASHVRRTARPDGRLSYTTPGMRPQHSRVGGRLGHAGAVS
ncbi:MAG: ester cyclase [Anaerolineae bacterium]